MDIHWIVYTCSRIDSTRATLLATPKGGGGHDLWIEDGTNQVYSVPSITRPPGSGYKGTMFGDINHFRKAMAARPHWYRLTQAGRKALNQS